ncbi:MAG: phenylacetate-CoA oxygenase subunit PaaI [Actinomycetota bacterium]|nr:phenylacetate-CoA oxygenase subunit PaaI [Actinomycetota bacterium]
MTSPTLDRPFTGEVANASEAHALGAEYVRAVGKVISSHVRNELAGAVVFDEPAIAMAPAPKEKWLACRIAMEEYGHHLKFNKLAAELALEDPLGARTLSVFDYDLRSWTDFVVLKAVVDLAEVVLMEELKGCSYLPLRHLATELLPEERFHVAFGRTAASEMAAAPSNRSMLTRAVHDLVHFTLPFFGRSVSSNNEQFRRWGIKHRTNDESRVEFITRCRRFVVDDLGLEFPAASTSWRG